MGPVMLAAASDAGAGVALVLIFVVYGLLILATLGGYALGIWALVDQSSKPDWAWQRTGDSKNTYLVLIVVGFVMCQLVSLVTAIVYLTSVRKRLQAAVDAGPPAYAYGYGYPGYGYPQGAVPPSPYGYQGYAPGPGVPGAPPAGGAQAGYPPAAPAPTTPVDSTGWPTPTPTGETPQPPGTEPPATGSGF